MPDDDRGTADRLQDRSWGAYSTEQFPVDVSNLPTEFRVVAVLPELDRSEITVLARRESLRIVAREHSGNLGPSNKPVSRTVSFPDPIYPRSATAHYDDDILTVTVNKQ